MSSATQRFMSYSQGEGVENKQKQIFNISVLLHIGVAIIVALFLEGVGYFLFDGILNMSQSVYLLLRIFFSF